MSWQPDGLRVENATTLASAQAAVKIVAACSQSGALTLEAWVTPTSQNQGNQPRIVTVSSDPFHRDLTLAQEQTWFIARVRTSATSENGLPELTGPANTVTNKLTHLVFTRDAAGNDTLYVNGAINAKRVQGGDLSTWEIAFKLALANEPDNTRPWLGTFHMVAVYDRALSSAEVVQHHQAGVP